MKRQMKFRKFRFLMIRFVGRINDMTVDIEENVSKRLIITNFALQIDLSFQNI